MSLLFNMLSRLVIAFLQRSKNLLIFTAAITVLSDFGRQENKAYHCFHCFPIYFPWSDGTGCHNLNFFECWVLSQRFHSPLSCSWVYLWLINVDVWQKTTKSYKPIILQLKIIFLKKRLFSASSFSAIRVVSSAYLRLLIFLLAILIPACALSSPAVHMMYSAYKLNNQGNNI